MVSGRESIFAWIENWLRDKKERVERNGCFFKQGTRIPQEMVLSLALYNTQETNIEPLAYTGPALSMEGIQTSQTQFPSWNRP